MGFRFRKSIGLGPGLKINLSKGLPSLSVGGRGLTFNLSRKGIRSTAGLPGSGLSYSESEPYSGRGRGHWWFVLLVAAAAVVVALLKRG